MTTERDVVLELAGARATRGAVPCDLAVAAGELVLLQAPDRALMTQFTDLCCGVLPAAEGAVRLLGQDFASLPADAARRLRARIGVVSADGGWAPHLPVAEGILLPALFHRLAPRDVLIERAAELCRRFGLPGLPLDPPRALSEEELARAACARAFLGRPELILLESPLRGGTLADLRLPLLEAIAAARDAACLWLTASASVWADRAIPARRRFRLTPQGLQPLRRMAA